MPVPEKTRPTFGALQRSGLQEQALLEQEQHAPLEEESGGYLVKLSTRRGKAE